MDVGEDWSNSVCNDKTPWKTDNSLLGIWQANVPTKEPKLEGDSIDLVNSTACFSFKLII